MKVEPGTVFRCGHARTEANTKLVRNRTGVTCRECFNAHGRLYFRHRYEAKVAADGKQVRPYRPRAALTLALGEQS